MYLNFSEAIKKSILENMKIDKNIIIFGLGVTDPKNIFGTTEGLLKIFGKKRVLDVPCSENALTGIALGTSLLGKKVIFTHQRFDFTLLSFDQLINNIAKWKFMFATKRNVNITLRVIIGKGWGQGPTHSQNFQSMLAHIPGLKILFPSNANDVYNSINYSLRISDPVIIIEHRWLYNSTSRIKKKKLVFSKKLYSGDNCTIVAMGNTVPDAIRLAEPLKKNNITADIFDLLSISPLELSGIVNSVKKTKKLILLEPSHKSFSVSSEIISRLNQRNVFFSSKIISLPDQPVPTSFYLTKKYYPSIEEIYKEILSFLNIKNKFKIKITKGLHDVPGEWFSGPF